MKTFSQKLALLAKLMGQNGKDLARTLDIGPTYYSQLLRGSREPSAMLDLLVNLLIEKHEAGFRKEKPPVGSLVEDAIREIVQDELRKIRQASQSGVETGMGKILQLGSEILGEHKKPGSAEQNPPERGQASTAVGESSAKTDPKIGDQ